MIDTHTHLYLEDFDEDRDEVMHKVADAGLRHLVLPNVDLTTIEPMHNLHDAYPQFTSMAMGLHPTEVDGNYREALATVKSWFERRQYVAVGEVGIDLYWDKTYRNEQMAAFAEQLRWAVAMNLPVIIHCREGLDEVLEVMDEVKADCGLPQCVFHSFTGTPDDVEQIRLRGDFYFGINGIVTFKKSAIPQLLPVVGIDRLLLETDSPYLAPVPNRGRRNDSSNVPHICNCIASHLGLTPDEVSRITDDNAVQLFQLKCC